MRAFWGLLVSVVLLLGAAPGARADTRVALVIGNAAYQNAARLPNPTNDAAAVAALLRAAGFEAVELQTDLGGNDLRRALRNFSAAAQRADVALVYFAGHGIEVDGSNYLIPVDARLERDLDVEDESLSLERVLKIIEPAKRLRLVILDACRDNPFARNIRRTGASRSIGRGLARVEPTVLNTLIAFAAKAGSTAADGSGDNSPFTAALLKHLTQPGLDLRIAFGRIRDDVLETTANRQEPFVYGSLGGSLVSLMPEAKKPEAQPSAPTAAPARPTADPRADYELAERVGTIEAWDYFLAAHGSSGYYANLARAQRAKLLAARPEVPAQVAVAPATPEPPIARPPAAPTVAPRDLARDLQQELKRVGCEPGPIKGEWSDQARRALEAFNRHAGTRLDVKLASIDALDTVRATTARVCPLVCARGKRADGDQCVKIVCGAGSAPAADGTCQKIKPKPAAKTARAKSGGGRCLTFGGRRLCQ